MNLLSPELNCPYASLLDCIDGVADWRLGKLKNKNQIGIQVESERVLTVYTASPCQYLPLILCHHAFSAVHPSQLKDVARLLAKKEFKDANDVFIPISSGPFKVGKISEDEIFLDKNMEYWDESFVRLSKIKAYLNLKDDDASYKIYSPKEYYEAIKKPGYNLAVLSWIADFADPTSFLEMFRPDSNINYTAWNSSEYENLLRLANAEDDVKKRYKKLSEVEQLLLNSHVIIPLSHNPSINVVDLYSVAGWYPNAINIHPFKFIKFKKNKALPGIAIAF